MTTNLPATQWQASDGLSEFTNGDQNFIVDTAANFLVDPSGNFIVDTGVTQTTLPATEWTEDNSQ